MTTITAACLAALSMSTTVLRAKDSDLPANVQADSDATMTAVARQATGLPGGLVAVDVFVGGIDDLGAYQIELTSFGGATGSLAVEDVEIDRDRSDYVFAGDEIIDFVRQQQESALLGVVAIENNVATYDEQMYAATFYFRASPNAKGTFVINIAKGQAASIMTTPSAEEIPFDTGEPTVITIEPVKSSRAQTR